MKNIHILPTDKPSKLYYNTKGKNYAFSNTILSQGGCVENQYIYITSDEKIKKGDWCINPKNDKVMKVGHHGHHGYSSKKIILTTDQDLIKDGIQSIDDEFLEWFVKNPSCEYVELKGYAIILPGESCDCYNKCDICKEEEPKQETLEEVPNKLDSVLAKITHQNDLGLSQWYEVVYYDIDNGKWCSYSGSKTFEDGERVIEWKYCKEIF